MLKNKQTDLKSGILKEDRTLDSLSFDGLDPSGCPRFSIGAMYVYSLCWYPHGDGLIEMLRLSNC